MYTGASALCDKSRHRTWPLFPTPNVNTVVGPVTASIHLPLRLGILDCEHAPIHMLPVEFLFGRVSSFYRIHLDKAEALRATRISICYHDTRFYRPLPR